MPVTRKVQGYGWRPSLPDIRDRLYHLEEKIYQGYQLPKKVDLWPHVPSIWNQEQLGSCTAHGSLRAFLTMAQREGLSLPTLSRLEQYYNTREIESSTDYDSGGTCRDAVKALATYGCAPETDWPYDINEFTVKPPASVYQESLKHMAFQYKTIYPNSGGSPMRTALANGYAIIIGFSVPDYFETYDAANSVLRVPTYNDNIIGGHCVAITGYDFSASHPYFICDNSWGETWGGTWGGQDCMGGRFAMNYKWFDTWQNTANDLWILQKVS